MLSHFYCYIFSIGGENGVYHTPFSHGTIRGKKPGSPFSSPHPLTIGTYHNFRRPTRVFSRSTSVADIPK